MIDGVEMDPAVNANWRKFSGLRGIPGVNFGAGLEATL